MGTLAEPLPAVNAEKATRSEGRDKHGLHTWRPVAITPLTHPIQPGRSTRVYDRIIFEMTKSPVSSYWGG